MKCKVFLLLLMSSMMIFSAAAQNAEQMTPDSLLVKKKNIMQRLNGQGRNKGTVTLTQPAILNSLLTHSFSFIDGTSQIKVNGYRVQLFAGSNSRGAREAAQKIAEDVKQQFDYRVYSLFDSPRWICRVGDFQSYEAANQAMRELRAKGDYKEAVIVRDKVLVDSY